MKGGRRLPCAHRRNIDNSAGEETSTRLDHFGGESKVAWIPLQARYFAMVMSSLIEIRCGQVAMLHCIVSFAIHVTCRILESVQ
jgi:hypothetical protein